MASINASMFPSVYKSLGVDTGKLGCVMLDVPPFPVTSLVHYGEYELFQHPQPDEHPHSSGAPAEVVAHVTLLYGLLKSGPEWQEQIATVLEGWELPDLTIEQIEAFPSHDEHDTSTIVGRIAMTPELLEGHQRLQLLPHVDTFPEYKPHITLAYINNGPSTVEWATSVQEKWVMTLAAHLPGRTFTPTRINYGD